MSVVPGATRSSEQMTVIPRRWRWYHAIAFYVAVQTMTFGLSGLVSLARGNRGQSLREATFGDVSYFQRLKQAKITPPSWAFGPAWFVNNVSVLWGRPDCNMLYADGAIKLANIEGPNGLICQ